MLEIKTHTLKAFEFISVSGRLTTTEAPRLEERIKNILDNNKETHLIFQLDQLEYCGSYGLRIFIQAKKDLKLFDGDCILYKTSPAFDELLRMAGLEQFFQRANNAESLLQLLLKNQI